jgi:23S rRNA (cytidine2498-2'-O)-methyltransferase
LAEPPQASAASRIFFATPGFEGALIAELPPAWRAGAAPLGDWPGLVIAGEREPDDDPGESEALDPVFARQQMPRAQAIEGASVAALAEACYQAVERSIDRAGGPFTIHTAVATGADPRLAARVDLVAAQTLALLNQRRRRAARLHRPPLDAARSFDELGSVVQVLLVARERGFASAARPRALRRGGWDLAPWPAGLAPVAEDRRPPSRAYRKLEEAFAWMDAEPRPGELCVDLGAAPGGWTYGALARGAHVIAVDRAPLAPPLDRHPQVEAMTGNAFTYAPPRPADWLLSDIVCEPRRALALIATWLDRDLCRNLIVTIKFKGRDDYAVLDEARSLFPPHWHRARIKHLHHNKNEVTVMASRQERAVAATGDFGRGLGPRASSLP